MAQSRLVQMKTFLLLVCLALAPSGAAGVLTGVTFSGHTDNYYFMEDTTCTGSVCCTKITVDYTAAATFKIYYNGTEIINTGITSGTNVVDLLCSTFSNEPGMYALTLTVEDTDTYSENMVAVYEHALSDYTVTPTHLFAEPGTNITFDMEVASGTNALFTVDLVTNIQLMKSCDGNTRTASYSQVFSDTGPHTVTTMVSNYGSKHTEVVVVNILYNLNQVTITADDIKPPGDGDPGIKVKMGSNPDLPMGNLTTWYTCSSGGTVESLDLSGLGADGEVAVPCPCTGQGNKTVTVNITTEMSTLQETFDIYCWDILNISITLEKDVQPINEIIPFIIENEPTHGMQWSIDACQGFTVSNENPSNYDDTYANNPLDLSTATFSDVGNCTLNATFWNEMYIVVLGLFFELDIGVSDLVAEPSATELLTGETFTIVVNASGPGIFYAVDLDEAMVVQDGCAGLVAEHNFSAAGEYNIEVMASNRVNNQSLTIPIVVANPINGYTVTVDTYLIQSTETVTFSVVLAASPDLPMGNLSVTISHCGTNESIQPLAVAASTTETFACTYDVQGNYSVNVTIASSVDAESYGNFEISVCDNLQTTISVAKTSWAVGEAVAFTLNTLPTSGFQYDIDMGDGSTTHVNADSDLLLLPNAYTAIPDMTYTAPNDYNITFLGYNQCYSVTSQVSISVQYGIPNCTLDVQPPGTIVSPDHTVSFNFVTASGTTAPNPNGVTCDYNFGEGTPVADEAAVMDFSATSTGYTLTHNYTTEGLMSYTFACENLVSSVSFADSLQVYLVTANAFTVTYPPVTALSEGSCATFDITLDFHGLTYVPQNVQYAVDHGDGVGVSSDTTLTSYTISKSLCTRGDFTGDITLKYDSVSNPNPLSYALGTCNVVKTTVANDGIVGDTTFSFDVTNHLSTEAITVTIDWKDDSGTEDVSVNAAATVTVTHVFNNHGKKRPTYSSTNSVGSDTASLVEELYIMYPVADLRLEVIEPVLLGVAIEPVIHYEGSNFLTNLTCEFLYEPLNDERETLKEVDLDTSSTSTTAAGFSYMDIKEETVTVTCSNPLSSQDLNVTFEVSSDCFEAPDIFESIHRRIDTPFRAYLHLLPTLTGSVKLTDKCKNTTEFKFEWTFKRRVIGTLDTFDDYAIATPNQIAMNLAMSDIEEGFYYVELYMFLVERPADYLRDKQYMQILRPPLSCTIEGGDFNLVGQGELVTLDARTKSYDPVVGVNMESGLDFSWKCFVIPDCADTDAYLVPFSEDKTYQEKDDCGLALSTEGFIRVDTTPLAFNQCYVFEQTISKDNRNASDIQVVKVLEEKPCKVAIMCHKNCQQKITAEEPSSFEINIECDGANQTQLDAATYTWLFQLFQGSSFVDIAEWKSIRGKHEKLFELNPFELDPGSSYKLTALAEAAAKPEGMAYLTLVGNEKPRGSACELTPLEGTFLNVTFTLKCENWLDEGIRNTRDDDLDKGEPLRLAVYQDGKLLETVDFTNKVTVSKLDLAVGLEANGYMTKVTLQITDMFNGMEEFNFDVKYMNSRPDLPAFGVAAANADLTEEDLEEAKQVFTDFLDNLNDTVAVTEGMGDPLQTSNVVAAMSSTLDSIQVQTVKSSDVEAVTTDDVETAMSSTLEAGTTNNPYIEQVQEVKETLAAVLRDSIQGELDSFADSGVSPPLSTITAFADAITASASNPEFATANSLLDAGESIAMLSRVIGDARNSTLSVGQAEAMKEAAISALDAVIATNSFYGVPGIDIDGDEVFDNATTTTGGGFNIIEADFLKTLLKRKEELRLKNAEPELLKNIANIIEATSNILLLAQSLITDNSSALLERDSYVQYVEKASASDLIANAREVNGSSLSVESVDGLDLDNEIVEQSHAVYNRNPMVTGEKAKMVEHPVTFAFIAKKGKKLKLKNPTITTTDPIEAGFTLVRPTPIDGDAGQAFYHTFAYRSLDEQICITARPQDTRVCYDACIRAIIAPSPPEADHCEQNINQFPGNEYCTPAAGCKRPGVCWISLTAYLCDDRTKTLAAGTIRFKRAADNTTTTVAPTINSTEPLLTPYFFRVITLSCLNWDGAQQDWRSDECKVSRDPDNAKTRCVCGDRDELITTVSFFVAPNSIDFSTVFSKFDIAGQGAVLGTILVVFVLFVIFLFWGRYMDGQDVLQWGVTLMADNYRQDSYFYLVTVHTGMVRHGGTTSNISFCIAGEEDDTGVRMLSDGVRQEMKAGSTMHFLMAVPNVLGTLQCFRIWHDNSGKGDSASWYLNRVEVTDLQTNDRYDFLCYKWMALEEGILDRAIPLSSVENMKNFKTMFFEHARKHLTDDHLWVSVMLRPVKSHFSRVQRIGCCYALLMLAMIANAMFFQSKDNKDRKQTPDFALGPISFSVSQIYISFISTIITAVPVFFIMLLFRKSKLSAKATKDGARLWMPKCFRGFKFYKQSKAIEKIMVIRDIVDDQDGVLPHFCVYISWVFCFCCVFVSAFFIMLYSMEWGKDISEEWLVTFILSFFESLIIMDPVKVLVLAILFALLLKTIKASKPSEFQLPHIERMVREHGLVGEGRARMDYRSPFSEEELQDAKRRYIRKKTMRKAVQELLTNVFFLIILCSISYSNRDPLGFKFHENISNMFMEPFKPAVTLKHINSSHHYFRWLRETVIPNMFPTQDTDGSFLSPDMRLRISDLQNYRVGAPRLRQVRQAQKSCKIPYVGTTTCYPIYDLATEENRDWCQGWRSRPPCPDYQELAVTNQAWTFVSALDIWGLPITGQLNVYGGGGYIAELDISKQVAEMTYDELFTHRWIDRNTRAVFLEFTLYNVNKNMFCYVSILCEFPESGGVHEFTNVYPFRSYNHLGTIGQYILVCEIVFGVFSLLWLGYIIFRLTKERWSFFRSFWNVVELVSVVTSFSAVVLYFIRLSYTNEAMALFKENDRVFINFYHIAVWDSIFVYVLAFLVGIATLRLLKVMGYSRVTQIVYLVLKESSKTLPGFFFYIMLILAAYGLLGYIYFGKTSYAYKDPITTMETLFSAVLGHAGFRNTNMPTSDTWTTLLYFSSFIMIVVFALSNIFMTILLDTMSMIGDDPKNLNYKEIELFAYMYESAKAIITGQKEERGLDTSKGGPGLDEKKDVPFTVGGYNMAGMEAHNRKLQMKMDMAALSGNANKPAYK